jgi:hypothetical protein
MARRARGKRAAAVAPPLERARLRTGGAGRLLAALRAHEHRTAAGLFGLFVLVYLWPALVGGDVLSPASVLYGLPPWQSATPPEGINFYNGLLSDAPTSYYPWDVLARELLHAGTFPAWNPHAFAGTPFFANLSVAWLSPFSVPLWTLPLPYALGVAAALKLWVAAFGTYLLVRELRLGFWAGLAAGVSFALCAFNVVWLSHGAHVSVAVLLPWTIWLAERIVRRGGRVEGVALAAVVAVALAGGHPGTQVHVLAGTLLYAAVRVATTSGVAWGERLRRLATLGAGMAVGVLLMAVVLLPGAEAAVGTIGAEARRNGGSTLIGSTLPLDALRAALFPDWWGRPSEALITGPANYNERAVYAGGLALVLAVLALVSPGAWRRKAGFLPLAALGLAVPFDLPLVRDLVVGLPGFDRVQNQRLLLWFAFAVAVLSAFGLQALLDAPRRQLRAWAVAGAAIVAGVVAIGSIELAPDDAGLAVDHLTDRFAGSTPGALALASVVRWLVLVAAFVVALLLLRARPRRPRLAGGLVALAAALDVLLLANAYQPMGPASIVIPPRTPAVAFLQRHADDGRIAGLGNALATDWSTVYGLRDVRGYDAPQPSRRFFRLWRTLAPAQQEWRPFDVPALAPESLPVLGLLGARYIVAAPGTTVSEDRAFRPLSIAYSGGDATVLENALASPRALVATRVRVAANEDEEIAAVMAPGFDPRRDAIVRREEVGDGAFSAPAGRPPGTVRVVDEANARVTLQARLPRRGVVVLDDAWAPGWSVTVDGAPARELQANVVMRGVVVPAGAHEIVWSYRVPGLRLGALLSALGLLALLGWAAWLVVRARRGAR